MDCEGKCGQQTLKDCWTGVMMWCWRMCPTWELQHHAENGAEVVPALEKTDWSFEVFDVQTSGVEGGARVTDAEGWPMESAQ